MADTAVVVTVRGRKFAGKFFAAGLMLYCNDTHYFKTNFSPVPVHRTRDRRTMRYCHVRDVDVVQCADAAYSE